MTASEPPWSIDDVLIHRLVENDTCHQTVEQLLPGLTLPAVLAEADWLAGEALDPKTGVLYRSYHSYVVETPSHRVLIDTCIGNGKNLTHRPDWHRKSDTRWLEAFEATGLSFADIEYVLCTHLHVDHVGWNTRWNNGRWMPTFPNARHLVVAAEFDSARTWPDRHPADPSAPVFRASFEESVAPLVSAGRVELVGADHSLGEYFRYLPTPGHTLAHSTIAVGKARDTAVFTGDLFHSPVQTVFPDVQMPYDDDVALAARTRRSFLAHYNETDTLVCSMHFPGPSVGHITRAGDGFRFNFARH